MIPTGRFLLVEGENDMHVVKALLQRHRIPEVFEVEPLGGIDRLLESVSTRLRVASGLERLAVVMDADVHLDQRWKELRDRLPDPARIALPKAPESAGTVLQVDEVVRFGAWLMPDNVLPGTIESFAACLIPAGDDLVSKVDDFLAQLPTPRRFADPNLPKARIHAWLSIQKKPGRPIGQAITARVLDPDATEATAFLNWIRRALVD